MDDTLQALVQAAERGDAVPRVQVAVGLGLVSGTPISQAEYAELQWQSIQVDLRRSMRLPKIPAAPRRGPEGQLAREQRAAEEKAASDAPGLTAFAQESSSAGTLILKEIALVLATGETVQALTMRIPVEQVELWWAGTFDVKKAKKGGVGFVVGGLVPIDIGI